jgi:hypothetical protein
LDVHASCKDKSDDVKDSFYEELGRVFDQFPRYDMKILLDDFNAKVGREDSIFKPTIGNESSHEISNDNRVRVVNFATSKHLVVKSTVFPHRSIHKHNWTSPDGQTHNQIDHVLTDRTRHSCRVNSGEMPHILKKCTEIQEQNYFLTYNDDKEYDGEYGENNNSIILESKHYCFSFFRMAFFGNISRRR